MRARLGRFATSLAPALRTTKGHRSKGAQALREAHACLEIWVKLRLKPALQAKPPREPGRDHETGRPEVPADHDEVLGRNRSPIVAAHVVMRVLPLIIQDPTS